MFQVPPALLRPASKAQFHRAAETMLRTIAEDLGHQAGEVDIQSTGSCASTMGTVTLNTASLTLEIYMDGFGPRIAPRLVYRDRFNGTSIRFRWLSELAQPATRSMVLSDLKIIARACRRPSAPQKPQGFFARRLGSLFA